ncbi:MAG: hypothetical protein NXI13_16365 [Proteobacteria bacterium]|nr:hypothetical protein [Pseudomonadota bacterium]
MTKTEIITKYANVPLKRDDHQLFDFGDTKKHVFSFLGFAQDGARIAVKTARDLNNPPTGGQFFLTENPESVWTRAVIRLNGEAILDEIWDENVHRRTINRQAR